MPVFIRRGTAGNSEEQSEGPRWGRPIHKTGIHGNSNARLADHTRPKPSGSNKREELIPGLVYDTTPLPHPEIHPLPTSARPQPLPSTMAVASRLPSPIATSTARSPVEDRGARDEEPRTRGHALNTRITPNRDERSEEPTLSHASHIETPLPATLPHSTHHLSATPPTLDTPSPATPLTRHTNTRQATSNRTDDQSVAAPPRPEMICA